MILNRLFFIDTDPGQLTQSFVGSLKFRDEFCCNRHNTIYMQLQFIYITYNTIQYTQMRLQYNSITYTNKIQLQYNSITYNTDTITIKFNYIQYKYITFSTLR